MPIVFYLDGFERTGRYAEAAVIAATDVKKRWLSRIHAHNGVHFTDLSRQTTSAGPTAFGFKP